MCSGGHSRFLFAPEFSSLNTTRGRAPRQKFWRVIFFFRPWIHHSEYLYGEKKESWWSYPRMSTQAKKKFWKITFIVTLYIVNILRHWRFSDLFFQTYRNQSAGALCLRWGNYLADAWCFYFLYLWFNLYFAGGTDLQTPGVWTKLSTLVCELNSRQILR